MKCYANGGVSNAQQGGIRGSLEGKIHNDLDPVIAETLQEADFSQYGMNPKDGQPEV